MASVSNLGIGSGVLTADFLEQLVKAERAPIDLRLKSQEAKVEAQLSAYGTYKSIVSKLQQKTEALADSNAILNVNAQVSNENALGVTTTNLAEEGSYQIAIDQLAQSHSLASSRFNGVDDVVGTGTLSISLGEYSYKADGSIDSFSQNESVAGFDIQVDSSNNTLQGVRDAINAADQGVQASLVNDGQGYKLLLSSSQTGKEYAMRIEANGDAGLQKLAYNELQQSPGANLEETQQGTNANISVNGLAITSENNEVSEVIKGVTLNLSETTSSAISLNLRRDTSGMVNKINEFVSAYNDYRTVYSEVTKYDQDNDEGGLLNGDATIRIINSQVRSLMTSIVDGLGDSSVRSLADIGIYTDSTNGFNLAFDSAQFTKAINRNANDVAGLLATDISTSDSSVKYLSRTTDTEPGEYDINVTKMATQAELAGTATQALSFASPLTVDSSNNQFTLNLDGQAFDVSINEGTYNSGEELALAMQNAINVSAPSGKAATVQFDGAKGALSLSSNTFGSASTIAVESADPSFANTFGLAVAGAGQVSGAQFANLNELAFAANTKPGIQAVSSDSGLNFASNTTSFDLSFTDNGTTTSASITLDEDWSDQVDLNGNVTSARDRSDALAYIQSELDSAGLTSLTASFNKDDRLVFSSASSAGNQSITVSNVNNSGTDLLGLEAQTVNSGVTLDAGATFEISIDNRYGTTQSGTISVPAGTYETGDEIAAAIQQAINADTALSASASGAKTEPGSRDISGTSFASDPAELVLSINGVEQTFTFNTGDGSDPIANLNSQLAGSGVEASLSPDNGLILTTTTPGSDQTLAVVGDGRGARTAAGTLDLSADTDFATNNAVFSLGMAGAQFDVTVDASTGGGTAQERLGAIQAAVDEALLSEASGEFSAGDIVAKLDGANQVYFESVSKGGVPTAETFGGAASISLLSSDTSGTNADLGLASATYSDGKSSLGLSQGTYQGFDGTASVSYQQTDSGGGFAMEFDSQTTISIANASDTAISQLGLSNDASAASVMVRGEDIEGTINGFEAIGNGQVLSADRGNEDATNGYLLGGAGWNFNDGAAAVDGTNKTLKLSIDGVQTNNINIPEGAYASGESLAKALKSAINADSNLQSRNKAVDVQYDEATGIFGIFSVTKGERSTVSVDEISSGGVDLLGFTTTTVGVDGKAAEGEANPADGLRVKVTGGEAGSRGSVSFVEGIAERLESMLQDMLSFSGIITKRTQALQEDKSDITEQKTELDERMLQVEERYKQQFLFNDKIVSRLNTTADFLTQQFEAMSAANKS